MGIPTFKLGFRDAGSAQNDMAAVLPLSDLGPIELLASFERT
jgi:hypothetical protein